MPSNPPILQLESLSKKFADRQLFQNVSLTLKAGESVAVMGPSGCGKTTLLSCILGLQTPDRGQVVVEGVSLAGLSRRQKARLRGQKMGVVFQNSELIDSLTALQNVALPALAGLRGRGEGRPGRGFRYSKSVRVKRDGYRQQILERAQALLQQVGVADSPTLAQDLSGGERQRVALARALMNRPRLILADEPTGSLDTHLRDEAAHLLFQVAREAGAALVVVTHDPVLAGRADRVFHLPPQN